MNTHNETTPPADTSKRDAEEAVFCEMEASIASTTAYARDRLTDLDHAGPLLPCLDAGAIEAIEAELMLSIYQARRIARLRLAGLESVPEANPEALALQRRSRGVATEFPSGR